LCARPGRRRIGARGEGVAGDGKGAQGVRGALPVAVGGSVRAAPGEWARLPLPASPCSAWSRCAARCAASARCVRACVRACVRPDRTCRTLRRVCAAQEKEAKIRNLQQRYAREQVGTPYAAPTPRSAAPIPLGKRARSYSRTDACRAAARLSARSRRGVWRMGCSRGVGWGTHEGYSRGVGWGTRLASLCATGAPREGRGEPQEAAGRPRRCARRERRGARQRQGASVRRQFGLARRR
jgi:hypothetical protein